MGAEYPTLRALSASDIPETPQHMDDIPLSGATDVSDKAGLQAMAGSGHYNITADIDCTGSWTPINNFSGVVEGNGHTISNLTLGNFTGGGLFYTILSGAQIRNLTIDNATITTTSTGIRDLGILAARMGIYSGTKVTNILIRRVFIINSTITCNYNAGRIGGFVGYLTSNGGVQFVECTLRNSSVQTGFSGGGIVGRYPIWPEQGDDLFLRCSVENCNLTGRTGTGGILGDSNTYTGNYRIRCHASNVTGTTITARDAGSYWTGMIGGFVGYCKQGIFVSCRVTDVTIQSTNFGRPLNLVGGFAGETGVESNYIDCYATGEMNLELNSDINLAVSSSPDGRTQANSIGGFSGGNYIGYGGQLGCWADVDINISNAGATPLPIESIGGYSGGAQGYVVGEYSSSEELFGNPASGIVERCYASGTITIDDLEGLEGGIGGFYGEPGKGGYPEVDKNVIPVVKNCYSTSTIVNTSGAYPALSGWGIGGFAGYIVLMDESATIANVFYAGVLPAQSAPVHVGGLFGKDVVTPSLLLPHGYWDSELSGISVDAGIGGTALTTALAKIQGSYELWDFTAVWYMPASVTLSDTPVEDLTFYPLGEIKMTSGDNDGFRRMVIDQELNTFTVMPAFPNAVRAGDTFILYAGCDKRGETCRDRYGNDYNFNGYLYIPRVEEVFM